MKAENLQLPALAISFNRLTLSHQSLGQVTNGPVSGYRRGET
jgi:hypothetical protein